MGPVRFLLLTEDSGREAHDTHEALVHAMLRLLAPGYDRRALAIEPANDAQRDAMRGNVWDSRSDRQRRVALVRSIATRICESNLHIVLFHYDGDRPWSDREACPRHAVFERMIVTPVRQIVGERRTAEQVERALARLVTVVPFYSVEAWLYQNATVAKRLCEEHHRGEHVEVFRAWRDDRAALDELHQPKRSCCLSDKYNRALAEERFPAADVYEVRRSFHDAVERLRGCADLMGVLAALSERGTSRA